MKFIDLFRCCKHPKIIHQHFRSGTYCGSCECPRYWSLMFWRRR